MAPSFLALYHRPRLPMFANPQLKPARDVAGDVGDDYFSRRPRLRLRVGDDHCARLELLLPPLPLSEVPSLALPELALPPLPLADDAHFPRTAPTRMLLAPLILDLVPQYSPLEDNLDLDHCFFPLNYTNFSFLIVDDNIINVKVLTKLIHKLYPNAHIILTVNLTQVPQMLLENHVDCVFMDIDMPVITGIDLALMIRAHPAYNRMAVIAVTTRTLARDLARYDEVGIDATISKPIRLPYDATMDRIDRAILARQ